MKELTILIFELITEIQILKERVGKLENENSRRSKRVPNKK